MVNFSSGDTVAPIVENVWPTGTGISLTPSTVRVQFNEDMHAGSFLGNATLVADDGTNVALAFIGYSTYNNQVSYQVNGSLEEYTEYTLSLLPGIQDESGNGLTGTTDYTFRTLSTSEPHIVDYEFNSCPAQNKVNVKVTYDRAMDPSTVDPTRTYSLRHY